MNKVMHWKGRKWLKNNDDELDRESIDTNEIQG